MTGLVLAGLWVVPTGPIAPKAATLADLAPLATAALLACLWIIGTRAAGLRLAAMPPGELLALLQPTPVRAPILALPPPQRRGHSLVVRRRARPVARPERGALAILTVAAVLALLMAVTTPRAPVPQLPPPETIANG